MHCLIALGIALFFSELARVHAKKTGRTPWAWSVGALAAAIAGWVLAHFAAVVLGVESIWIWWDGGATLGGGLTNVLLQTLRPIGQPTSEPQHGESQSGTDNAHRGGGDLGHGDGEHGSDVHSTSETAAHTSAIPKSEKR